MFIDRLTKLAQKRAQSRIITPVIIKARKNYLAEAIEYAKQFELSRKVLERGFGIIEALTPEFISFGSFPSKVFRNINMFSAILPREGIFDLADQSFVEKIYSDEQVWAFQYPTVPLDGIYSIRYFKKLKKFTSTWWTKKLIGADVANQKGFLGQGVLVSIVDTGAPHFHEQIMRCRIRTTIPFQRTDDNGHGSWCVSCVGGTLARDDIISQALGRDVYCEGMAPACDLLAVKSLGLVVGTGTTSWILDGIDISLDESANIISMSLGGNITSENPEDSPYYHAFEVCKERNCIPVVASGNSGPDKSSVNEPGNMPNCLTVGALDPITGEVAEFSSRGPTPDGRIKPDVVAPGKDINSACVNFLDYVGDNIPNRYSPLSGSSMATPHVSGILALMYQCHRELLGKTLTLNEIFAMMEATGDVKNNDVGWGMITWDKYENWIETQYNANI